MSESIPSRKEFGDDSIPKIPSQKEFGDGDIPTHQKYEAGGFPPRTVFGLRQTAGSPDAGNAETFTPGAAYLLRSLSSNPAINQAFDSIVAVRKEALARKDRTDYDRVRNGPKVQVIIEAAKAKQMAVSEEDVETVIQHIINTA